jgi:transcriptional regulator with XRE-family HTH domain
MIKIDDSQQIGEIVRKTRREQGLDQASFASICQFSERPLKAIEKGNGSLSVEKLLKIFSELGIQVYLELPEND